MEYTVQLINDRREVVAEKRFVQTRREAQKVLTQMKREVPSDEYCAYAINEQPD